MTDPVDDPILLAEANWQEAGWDAGPHFVASLSIVAVEQLLRAADTPILEPHGLTHTRHEALAVLYFSRWGELPLSALSRALLLHITSVTATVDVLERLGYLERVPHPEDRRTTLARITPLGRKVMRRTCQGLADARFGIGVLSEDEAMQLFHLLGKVRRAHATVVAP